MKIARIEDLHADAGWRTFSFLKITTDDGLVGWSEYTEADGSRGLTAVIHGMAETLIGTDPRPIQAIDSTLYVKQVQAPNGVNQRAIAAIGNALLDIKGKALGVPVYELFGGPVRRRIPVYWSHCGTYRVRNHDLVGVAPATNLRRRRRPRRRGQTPRLQGPENQHPAVRRRQADQFRPRLRPHARLPGAQRRPQNAAIRPRPPRRLPRGRRTGDGPAPRRQLPLQDRGLPADRQGRGTVRPDVAGDRHLGPGVPGADPQQGAMPHRLPGIGHRPPRLPPVPGRLLHRRRHHRRDLERLPGVDKNRRHGRGVRGQRRPAQLLRPPLLRRQRAFLRRGAQFPGDGNRHRQRRLAG